MPTDLPEPDDADYSRPSEHEVLLLSRGVASAVMPRGGMSTTQRLLMRAVFSAMTTHDARDGAPIDAETFALGLAKRNLEFRTRIVQIMVLLGLVLRPIPPEVAARIEAFAAQLMVQEGMVEVARRFAEGSLGLAAVDFERNGYSGSWEGNDSAALHTARQLEAAWDVEVADPGLAQRWEALERLPAGSLGRLVAQFYKARGFRYPGRPGSAPPLLAQHDWVHVVADFGTSVESVEVFAFIARANDDLRAFSLLAMVVSLFETGYLRSGAGLFESAPGHLSGEGMATRVADAMRRGAECDGSIDFLRTDWFALADLSLAEARAHFGVPAKSSAALDAGSAGPWEPGGISTFQIRAGTAMASNEGRPYDSFGATTGESAP